MRESEWGLSAVLPGHWRDEPECVQDIMHEHSTLREHERGDGERNGHGEVHGEGVHKSDGECDRSGGRGRSVWVGRLLLRSGERSGELVQHDMLEPGPLHDNGIDQPDMPSEGMRVAHG